MPLLKLKYLRFCRQICWRCFAEN